MASQEQQFDSLLLGIAQQMSQNSSAGGIPELLDVFFGFLRRKTDFYVGDDKARKMVDDAFNKQKELFFRQRKEELERQRRNQELQEKKRQEEEIRKKRKEEEEQLNKSNKVEEVPDDTPLGVQPVKEESKPPIEQSNNNSNTAPDTKSTEEKSEGLAPTPGNGSVTDKYSWTQTLAEIEVRIPLESGTRGKDLLVEVKKTSLKVQKKANKAVLVEGKFSKEIKTGDMLWSVEEQKELVITFNKKNQMEWWSHLLEGEPEIDTKKIVPENSQLGDLDPETRQTVEKMMFDQQQKQRGLPTSEETQKQEMLQKFMKQHPEMDFSKVKFN